MARTITADEWNQHWDEIIDIYVALDWTLTDVRDYMIRRRDFHASENQYKKMFDKWHVNKNILKDEKWRLLLIDNQRQAEGKNSRYTLWNKMITREDFEGWRRDERARLLKTGKTGNIQKARLLPNGLQAMSGLKISTITASVQDAAPPNHEQESLTLDDPIFFNQTPEVDGIVHHLYKNRVIDSSDSAREAVSDICDFFDSFPIPEDVRTPSAGEYGMDFGTGAWCS